MTLLQALSGSAGLKIVIFEVLFVIVAITISILLTNFLMKTYWNFTDRKQNITDGKPYYKEPVPFLISILLAVMITLLIIYVLLLLIG